MSQVTKVEIDGMKKMKCYSFNQYKIKTFNAWSVILPIEWTNQNRYRVFIIVRYFSKNLCVNMLLIWQSY